MRKAIATTLLLICIATLASKPASSAGPLTAKSICLDPGHGGGRGGAVNSAYGLDESEINLDVAYGLKALLERDGATVYMTREGDETVVNRERARFCNRTGADILISVHTNSVPDASWNGTLGLYYKEEDELLTWIIQEAMYTALRATAPDRSAFRNFGLMYRRLRVLRATMPATLVEPVFMSNPGEAKLLGTPIYGGEASPNFETRRGQIAMSIHDGVLRYFATVQPLPPPLPPTPTPPSPTPVAPTPPRVTFIPISYRVKGM